MGKEEITQSPLESGGEIMSLVDNLNALASEQHDEIESLRMKVGAIVCETPVNGESKAKEVSATTHLGDILFNIADKIRYNTDMIAKLRSDINL